MADHALIVGGSGFIGSHLVERLLQQNYEVTVLDRNDNPTNLSGLDVRYICGDLTNINAINQALSEVDFVFHLASTSTPTTSVEDPIADIHGNVLGTVNLLNAMLDKNVKKILFVSSGGTVYGVPKKLPIRENDPTNPISSYGITKLAIEKYIQMYQHIYGISYRILRVANAYGPRQNPKNPQGAISVMLRAALNGQPFSIWGDGSIRRDFVYVTDLVEAIIKASQHESNLLLNIASEHSVSVNELVELCSDCGVDVTCRYEAARPWDVPEVVLDISQAKDELGWMPTTTLEAGVRETISYLKS